MNNKRDLLNRSGQVCGKPHTPPAENNTPASDWGEKIAGEEPLFTPRRQHSRQPFLKGPVPLDYLQKASCVNALRLAIYVWWKAGILGQGTEIQLRPSELRKFGLSSASTRREFQALVEHGLVHPVHKPGRCKAARIITEEPASVSSSVTPHAPEGAVEQSGDGAASDHSEDIISLAVRIFDGRICELPLDEFYPKDCPTPPEKGLSTQATTKQQ